MRHAIRSSRAVLPAAAGGLLAAMVALALPPTAASAQEGRPLDGLLAALGTDDARERALAACRLGHRDADEVRRAMGRSARGGRPGAGARGG